MVAMPDGDIVVLLARGAPSLVRSIGRAAAMLCPFRPT